MTTSNSFTSQHGLFINNVPNFRWLLMKQSYKISKNPLRILSGYINLLNFTCLTVKFQNYHYVNELIGHMGHIGHLGHRKAGQQNLLDILDVKNKDAYGHKSSGTRYWDSNGLILCILNSLLTLEVWILQTFLQNTIETSCSGSGIQFYA